MLGNHDHLKCIGLVIPTNAPPVRYGFHPQSTNGRYDLFTPSRFKSIKGLPITVPQLVTLIEYWYNVGGLDASATELIPSIANPATRYLINFFIRKFLKI